MAGENPYSKAVFFGRMIPIFRSLISIPAGIQRMPLIRFTLLTTAGSAIWNTVFVVAGFYLGENWHVVEQYADAFKWVVVAVGVVAVAVFLFLRIRRIMRERAARAEASEVVPIAPVAPIESAEGLDAAPSELAR